MKRTSTYLRLAVFLLTALSLSFSSQAEWKADRSGTPANSGRPSATPQLKYLHNKGISAPGTRIRHAATGEAPTPAVAKTGRSRANILKSPQAPRGNIYGVVNRFQGIETTGQAYVGKLDLSTGAMQRMHSGPLYSPYADDDYLLQTNTLRQGEIICPSVMTADNYMVTWDFIDLQSGDYLRTLDFGSDMFANPYTMTYDPDHDLIYMVCIDGDTDGQFSVADPKDDYSIKYIGNLRAKGGFIAAIAYNMADGQLYAFNNFNTVFTLDTKSGTLVEAGYLELPTGEYLFEEGTSGQVTYSPADEMFVCIFRDNSIQASRILYIHPETFEVFEGPIVTADHTPYITSIFCSDEFAMPDAPEISPAITADFAGASLSGNVTFTSPLYTYAGVALGSTKVRLVLTVDGKAVYDETVAPGVDVTIPLTLTQGEHELVLASYIGTNRSPERRLTLYTGNDNPMAPAGITLDGDRLSWEAPGAIGVHKGYVDTSALTYDVYLEGKICNPAPLTETSYTLERPASYDVYAIDVVAHANSMDSPKGSLHTLFGQPMTLPFHQAPTAEQARFYTVVNSNRDERTWFYTSQTEDEDSALDPSLYGWCFATGYLKAGDDWLFLPLLEIDDPSKLYTLGYSISGIFTLPTVESYEVWIGKGATPEAMTQGTCILSQPFYYATTHRDELQLNFGVEEPGYYYIGFHATGSPETESQGILISDLDVRSTGESSAIPADPTGVTVKAAPYGKKAVEISLTLPTLDLSGKELPASELITVTATDGIHTATASGTPGTKAELELEVSADGFAFLSITPSNANGDGYTRNYSLYAGIDRPMAPGAIHAEPAADNMSVTLTWSAPATVGENGGYVDPAGLTYNIYARSESNTVMLMGSTKDLTFTMAPFSSTQADMRSYSIGVSATNEGGESYNTQYTIEHLGTPNELPVMEEFSNQGLTYSPYTALTTGIYANSAWEIVTNMDGVGVGNPPVIQGALVAYSTERAADAKIILPKVSTVGIAKSDFILRYWDYTGAPDKITVYGRRYGATDETVVGEFTPSHSANGKWNDAELMLPAEFNNAPWIEFRLGCHFPARATNEYLIIDSYQFFPDVDNDLKVSSLSGPEQTCIGETVTYHVAVANSGRERASGKLTVALTDAAGKALASADTKVPNLNANQTFEYDATFDINGTFSDISQLTVVASLESEDENLANNSRSLAVKVMRGSLPVVNDLMLAASKSVIGLDWSEPSTEYGDFENFESHSPFEVSDQLEMWGNVDLDGMNPIGIGNSTTGQELKWNGSNQPQAWTVIDMEQLGFINDARLAPHSGKNVLIARAGDYPDEDDPQQSSKWLISPEIKGGTELSFWMNTIAGDLKEFIEVWYSETDTRLDPETATSTRNGSFRRLRNFSKEGAETWEHITCQLPAGARYFAIRYCSYDGAAVMIDDISFTPAKMLERKIDHYVVYISEDGVNFSVLADNITTPGHTADFPVRGALYYVTTVVDTEGGLREGPKSNIVQCGTVATTTITADTYIYGTEKEIVILGLENEYYNIVSSDGRCIASGQITANRFSIHADSGIYIVTAGSQTATILVR